MMMKMLPRLTVCTLLLAALLPATAAGPVAESGVAAPLPPAGEGRRAFLKFNCYSCHGMYAAGGMGPNIVHAERGDLGEAIKHGESGGMPGFGRLVKSVDIKNIGSYLNSIGTTNEPKFMDWWEPIPPK